MIEARMASADSGFITRPLEAPGFSGYLAQGGHKRRDPLAPPPVERESRVAVPMREIVCYECGKTCSIPAAALSASCSHCSAHLNTDNITVKPGTRHLRVRTLGDVRIPSSVELSGLDVICHHLHMAGRVNGTLRATGNVTLAGHATVGGKLVADELIVQRGAKVEMQSGISVEHADVHGAFSGRLYARDSVHIYPGGKLNGPCCTPYLQIDPGGRHIGARETPDSSL